MNRLLRHSRRRIGLATGSCLLFSGLATATGVTLHRTSALASGVVAGGVATFLTSGVAFHRTLDG